MPIPDELRIKTKRSSPSQVRGKERVRVILAAALHLFNERGIEQVTTNDIVERAGVPIGSLYQYFPNKEAIVTALVELYVADITKIFAGIGKHPMIKHLSWDELLLLMVDGWVNYVRLNNSFALLLAVKANPHLFKLNQKNWRKLIESFGEVLLKRCPSISQKDIVLSFQFCVTAVEMGVHEDGEHSIALGSHPHYEAVGVIAAYLLRVCNLPVPNDDTILS